MLDVGVGVISVGVMRLGSEPDLPASWCVGWAGVSSCGVILRCFRADFSKGVLSAEPTYGVPSFGAAGRTCRAFGVDVGVAFSKEAMVGLVVVTGGRAI